MKRPDSSSPPNVLLQGAAAEVSEAPGMFLNDVKNMLFLYETIEMNVS